MVLSGVERATRESRNSKTDSFAKPSYHYASSNCIPRFKAYYRSRSDAEGHGRAPGLQSKRVMGCDIPVVPTGCERSRLRDRPGPCVARIHLGHHVPAGLAGCSGRRSEVFGSPGHRAERVGERRTLARTARTDLGRRTRWSNDKGHTRSVATAVGCAGDSDRMNACNSAARSRH